MITGVVRRIGGTIVGWAVDTDVSALKTTPWEREKLGPWLNAPGDWDVMVWQRMDRAVRSMADMANLGQYARQHGKRLIFASGPGGAQLELDFGSPMSELIMLILAFAAQLEGQTILERNQGTAAHLQGLGRWPGGPVPYGFVPVRKVFPDGNEGWWLAEHKHTADTRRAMVARGIGGMSYNGIRQWLTETKAVTPANHRAELAGREPNPASKWTTTAVRSMLLSAIVRGHLVTKDGVTVRNADGSPVLQGAALVDDKTWYRLQEKLKGRVVLALAAPRRTDAHELLGVLKCHACGRNVYSAQRRARGVLVERQFRCNSGAHSNGEPYPVVNADKTLEYVSREFLRRFGFFKQTQPVHVPGVDNRSEIADLQDSVNELSGRLLTLRGPAADAVAAQLQGLSDRLEPLLATPFVPAREEVVELDSTWDDAWNAAEWAQRRLILLDLHVVVTVGPSNGWRRPVPERLTFGTAHPDPEADAMEDALFQATD